MAYRYLWTPLQLGPVTTRNRIVFSAHLTNYARDGKPTEQGPLINKRQGSTAPVIDRSVSRSITC